jgi:hypothetical protein
LAHDIESALDIPESHRRVSIGNGQKYKDQLTAKEWQDLIDFEGNANGFFSTYRKPTRDRRRTSYFVCNFGAFMNIPKRVYLKTNQKYR